MDESMDEAKKQVIDWLDDEVITETIFDKLQDEGVTPTFENATKVWLDVLYTELGDAVKRSVEALINKGEIK
jgi:hypothetical protein